MLLPLSFLTYGGEEYGVEGNRLSNHIIFLLHADDPPVEVSVVGGCLKDFVAAQINWYETKSDRSGSYCA